MLSQKTAKVGAAQSHTKPSPLVIALVASDDNMDYAMDLKLDTPHPMDNTMDIVSLTLDSRASDSSPQGVSLSVASSSGDTFLGAVSQPHDSAHSGVVPGLISGSPPFHTNS